MRSGCCTLEFFLRFLTAPSTMVVRGGKVVFTCEVSLREITSESSSLGWSKGHAALCWPALNQRQWRSTFPWPDAGSSEQPLDAAGWKPRCKGRSHGDVQCTGWQRPAAHLEDQVLPFKTQGTRTLPHARSQMCHTILPILSSFWSCFLE